MMYGNFNFATKATPFDPANLEEHSQFMLEKKVTSTMVQVTADLKQNTEDTYLDHVEEDMNGANEEI